MSTSRYPKYKDSGVQWLREVPDHWLVGKIHSFAKKESGHTPSRQHPEYWENCTIPWFTLADVWQIRSDNVKYVHETKELVSELGLANSSARLLPAGTVILSRTASVGYSAIMGREMATTQDFVNWICYPQCRPEFLLYVLRGMRTEFQRLMMGSTHQTLYMPDIAKLAMSLPPVDEQSTIVRFLDRETDKIDALIAEQEKLLTLLAEKHQATILRAVTRGLNCDVRMKNSGVVWLGQVPVHWVVCTLRRVLFRIEQGWSPECINRPADGLEWGVLKAGCLNGGVFNPVENKALPETLDPVAALEVLHGDLLMSRASGSPKLVGSVAYVSEPPPRLMLSDKIFRLHPMGWVLPRFLAAALNSVPLRLQIEASISGAEGLANNLPQSSLKDFWIAIPPEQEQEDIAAFIETETTKLNTLKNEVERVIALLSERRSAVIAAAVTGKIDVRNAVSQELAA
ncbi:restriction endonuclease subunit S [Paraburkholderia guartelaensis]|uniref:restriction endonuclease subunit S n=1 Tax=Paraburkholderia guartelaensis TaxID=2546446 RepID=UPI002AB7A18D|nr:restriction endonuclease subunit S [Paraburkholderia guartelaensis]